MEPEGSLDRITSADSSRAKRPTSLKGPANMTVTFSAGPVIALIAGILILIMPRLLNYIVAIYLIVIGLLGLFGGHGHFV